MADADPRLRMADARCRAVLRHYENFTVASRLSPRRLRRDLARVYAFCRTTDDIGDESHDSATATVRLLAWRDATLAMFDGATPCDPLLYALRATVRAHGLDAEPFLDLIDANLQDQRVAEYEDWPALHAYCVRSAAPVGRIVLHLNGIVAAAALRHSDDVCIGLQLANFAQDVRRDAAMGRTYLLQQELRALGPRGAVRAMCDRARTLLASGHELEAMVPPRLRLQLALYRSGGEAVVDAIAASGYTVHECRPAVTRTMRAHIAWRALRSLRGGSAVARCMTAEGAGGG